MDTFWAVILGLHLIPMFGTVAGMIREEQEARRIRGACWDCALRARWLVGEAKIPYCDYHTLKVVDEMKDQAGQHPLTWPIKP